MTRYAKRIDNSHAAIRDGLRDEKLGYIVRDYSGIGNGIPDLAVETRRNHVHLWLEVKTPGEKMTKAEKEFAAWFGGGKYCIVYDLEGAIRFCEIMDECEERE
jgi:hypothetical protein